MTSTLIKQIPATNNLVIHATDKTWQLKRANADSAIVIATGQGLRYSSGYARVRRLPDSATLTPPDLAQVVLGWDTTDSHWRLGLILSEELSATRDSKWCELATWDDPDATLYVDIATQAAQALSTILSVPIRIIPADQPAQTTTPTTLLPLPIKLGDWRLEATSNQGLAFIREPHWIRQRYQQALWYFFWALVYITISALTLTQNLALPNAGTLIPNPQWLPYIGLVTGVILVLRSVYVIWRNGREARRIEISSQDKYLRAYNNKKLLWEKNGHDILSVYVSEAISKSLQDRVTDYSELNLHLGSGEFVHLLRYEEKLSHDEMPIPPHMPSPTKDAIIPLSRQSAFTRFQVAGIYISELLGHSQAWYDLRQ